MNGQNGLTAEDRMFLAEIREMERNATPGPLYTAYPSNETVYIYDQHTDILARDMAENDAEFFAASRTAIPRLLALVDRLDAALTVAGAENGLPKRTFGEAEAAPIAHALYVLSQQWKGIYSTILLTGKRAAALETMRTEQACTERQIDGKCERDCAGCDLVRPDHEILAGFDAAIAALEEVGRRQAESAPTKSGDFVDGVNGDRCVCCGAVIPEGRQVCWKCAKGADQP